MKKLMIAAAIVCAAAFSQAATIDWSVANNSWTLQDGTAAAKGYTVYLVDGKTDLSTFIAAIDTTTGALNYKVDDGQGGQKDASWYFGQANTDNTKGRIPSGTKSASANLTAGKEYDFSVLLIDATGDKVYYQLSKVNPQTAYTPGVDEPLEAPFTGSFFGTNAQTYDATTAANGWAAVPEPTSAMLLLLGVAGLALRRHRA